ncbi:hypothetical protein GCM10009737_32530 [Nocardioides lentus]|uniref:Uncharacterized protein n=1 Tax=Nocardioides lentus TaxID=338077 RepID=A0ABP5B203_9ACTN
MEWWLAALYGAGGAAVGVWLTWLAPNEQGPFPHIPKSLREPKWWGSNVGWLLVGAFWAVTMNYDDPVTAVVAAQFGLIAPYVLQKAAHVARNQMDAAARGEIDVEDQGDPK